MQAKSLTLGSKSFLQLNGSTAEQRAVKLDEVVTDNQSTAGNRSLQY